MGKGGQRDKDGSTAERKEVLIEGRMYDITNLRHPGGSIINFYAGKGIDATQAFQSFHKQSKKARKYLNNLPSSPVDVKEVERSLLPGQADLLEDFNKLHRELEAEGLFEPSMSHVVYRCVEILVMYLVGGYLALHGNVILGIMLMAVAQGRCGWLMHEGGHYSLTGKADVNQ
jgi:hypothetical protein